MAGWNSTYISERSDDLCSPDLDDVFGSPCAHLEHAQTSPPSACFSHTSAHGCDLQRYVGDPRSCRDLRPLRYRHCPSAGVPPTPDKPKSAPFVPEEDRRVSPRLQPHEVPWIREVKPISGDGARLLNISRTGVLLETTARLQPGRRSTVVIVNDADQKERAEGQVIRTELVAIGKSGELIYRTALAFTREFDLKLPGVAAPVSAPAAEPAGTCVQLQLEGPLPGLFATERGSCNVQVAHISATGCYILSPGAGKADEWASVTLFFSPVRSMTLQGKVAAAEAERGCLLRFSNLDAETRRALRVEIREGIADGKSAPPQPVALGTVVDAGVQDVVVEWHTRAGTLHANQW